jgi:hypothetical protein
VGEGASSEVEAFGTHRAKFMEPHTEHSLEGSILGHLAAYDNLHSKERRVAYGVAVVAHRLLKEVAA